MIWRPVMAGFDSLDNVRHRWRIEDLFDAQALLDAREAAERRALQKVRAGS